MKIKNLFLQNRWANFNQIWHKASLDKGGSSFFKWRPLPFSRGDNYEIAKLHCQNSKIFSRTTWLISIKLSIKQSILGWRELKFVQIKGPTLFLRGNHYEIVKMHCRNSKIFSRTAKPISTKLYIKHPWVKKFKVLQIRTIQFSKKRLMGFSSPNHFFDTNIALLKCVNWFTGKLVSQVSDVAHGSLVYEIVLELPQRDMIQSF